MYNPKDNIYAYLGQQLQIPGENINRTGFMLDERAKFTSQTGIAIATTANSNLDGTGTLYDLITGASNGTLVKRIIIKAQGSTALGMVRIFFKAGASTWLMQEVTVPNITQAATDQTFIAVLDEPFYLESTYLLRVTTQWSNTFIVSAEGLDFAYPA